MTAFLLVLPVFHPESTFISHCHVAAIYPLLICNHTSRPSRKVHVDKYRTVVLLCEHVIVLEASIRSSQRGAVGVLAILLEIVNSSKGCLRLASDQVIEKSDVMIMGKPERLRDS